MVTVTEIAQQNDIAKRERRKLIDMCQRYGQEKALFRVDQEVKHIDQKCAYIVTDVLYDPDLNQVVYGLQQKGFKHSNYKSNVRESCIVTTN